MSSDDAQHACAREYPSQEQRRADLYDEIRHLDQEWQYLREALTGPSGWEAGGADATLLLSEISRHVRHMSSVIGAAGQSGHLDAQPLRSGRADVRVRRYRTHDRRYAALGQACARYVSRYAQRMRMRPTGRHALSLRTVAAVLVLMLVGLVILAWSARSRLPAGRAARPITPATVSSARLVDRGLGAPHRQRRVGRPTAQRVGALPSSAGSAHQPDGMPAGSTGAPSLLLLSPGSLQFGPQGVATPSAERTIYVTNLGPSTLRVARIAFGGRDQIDFDEWDTCTGTTIVVEGDCVIAVGFLPTQPGWRTAYLTIAATVGPPHSVALRGDGQRDARRF